MKKITFYAILLVLCMFSCKRQESMKAYVEKGFAKPTIGDDVHFTEKNIGDGGKLYVPSQEDIEVQFTIKNKHNQELTGTIDVPQDRKMLFNKIPEIKELTPTKLVIAFNFKKEAEPQEINQFLGESVNMTAKIFEKKTGRFLSSQSLTTSCNTPPPAMEEDPIYEATTDEYVVTLPRGEGIHQDLRDVRFTFSSAHGTETVEPKIISVIDAGEQGKQYTLKVKGNEGWQLKHPSGQRSIKATVYDRAGLKSSEKQNTTNRWFTSITLIPNKQLLSVHSVKEKGVPLPKIKELEEFFNGNDWQEKAGYTVTYKGDGFVYDAENKVLRKDNVVEGTYTVTVELDQGNGNVASAPYSIEVAGSNVAAIDLSTLTIKDATLYPKNLPVLQFDTSDIEFNDVGNVATANINVAYTGFDTKLNVHVEAISRLCKGEDRDGTSWGVDVYQKDYTVNLGKITNTQEQSVEFTIISEDNSKRKKYKIVFRRGNAPTVKVEFKPELLPSGSTAKVKISWKYNEEEFAFNTNGQLSKTINVGQDEDVNFEISVSEGVRVKDCISDFANHQVGNDGGNVSIKTTNSFTLVITLRPEATVKWDNYLEPNNDCGYSQGEVIYGDEPPKRFTPNRPDTGHAVIKDKPVKFKIDMLSSREYMVIHWKVNEETITNSKNDGSITLEDNKTILTIISAEAKDYVVSVITERVVPQGGKLIKEDEFKVEDITTYGNGADGNPVEKLTFGRVTFTDNASNVTANVSIPYTGKPTNLKVNVKAISNYFEGIDWNNATNSYENTGWGVDNKEYTNIVVPKDASSTTQLKFKIVLKNDHSSGKDYIITFTRGMSVRVQITSTNVPMLENNDQAGSAKILWRDNVESGDFVAKAATVLGCNVRPGETVHFKILSKDYTKIKSCQVSPTSYTIPSVSSGNLQDFSLEVTNSLSIVVEFSPDTTVKWENYKVASGGETTCGYATGEIKYSAPVNPDPPKVVVPREAPNSLTYAVRSGRDVVFKIDGFNSSTYAVEAWKVNNDSVTAPITDKYEFDANKAIFTIKNIQKGDYKVEVVVKKACTVQFAFEGLQGADNALDNYTMTVRKDNISGSIITPNPSDPLLFTRITNGTTLSVALEANQTCRYDIDKWTLEMIGSGQPPRELTGGTKYVKEIMVSQNVKITIKLKKSMLELTVDFEGLKGAYPHNLNLTATDVTNPAPVPINAVSSSPNKYRYSVVKGARVNLKITLNAGENVWKYSIKEWKDGDAKFADEIIEQTINMNSKKTIKIVLVPQYLFELDSMLDANAGQLFIAKSASETSPLETVNIGGGATFLKTAEDLYFKVTGLGTDNLVVSYKINGVEKKTEFFDADAGFWKTKGSGTDANLPLNMAPGDQFVAVIARVKRIQLQVKELDGANYENYTDDYTLEVKRDNASTEIQKLLFPELPGGKIEIDWAKINAQADKAYPIYITKGTRLKFNMTGLESDKEIGEWRNNNLPLGAEFNEDHNTPDLRIGKKTVTYEDDGSANYDTFVLKAIIRDRTRLLTVSIKDYWEKDRPFSQLTNDDNIKLVINIEKEGVTTSPIVNIKKDVYKTRLSSNENTKISITSYPNHANSSKYYFAMWDARKKSDGTSEPLERIKDIYGEDLLHHSNDLITLPNDKDVEIIGYYTKQVMIVMHPSDEGLKAYETMNDHLPPPLFNGDYGKTRVKVLKAGGEVIGECTLSNHTNEIKQFQKVEPQSNPDILIENINTDDIKFIQLEFEKSGFPDSKIIWKYMHSNLPWNAMPTNFPTNLGRPQYDGNQKVKFTDLTFLQKKPILHLWLYAVAFN